MGLLDSFSMDDDTKGRLLDATQAMGLALMSSPGNAPFQNLPQTMQVVGNMSKGSMGRNALKALLIQSGVDPAQADLLSQNETAAKLAIQQAQQQRMIRDLDGGGGGAAGDPLFGGGGGGAGAGGTLPNPNGVPPVALSGTQEERAKSVYDGLIRRGLPPVLAAGMVGNIGVESRFNPNAIGDKGTAFGYHQARLDRAQNLNAIAAERGTNWRDHDAQLDNIVAEFNGKDKGMAAVRRMVEANPNMSAEQAAALVARHGERPAASALAKTLAERQAIAAHAAGWGSGPAPVQVADASGAVPIPPVSRSPLPPPGRGPVRVAENERAVQEQESRMGMYPPSVYGVTQQAGAPEQQTPARPAAPVYTPTAQPTQVASAIPLPGGGTASYQSTPSGQETANLPTPDAVPVQSTPPQVQAQIEQRAGPPPAAPQQEDRPTSQQSKALQSFNYWARRLRVAAVYGDAGKGAMEEAKQRMELAAQFLKPTDTERLADAAGLQGTDRQRVIRQSMPGQGLTSDQKEYETYSRQEEAAGRTPLSFFDYQRQLKASGANSTKINTAVNPIVKGLGEQFVESRNAAMAATRSIPSLHEARALLDQGIFSGTGAEFKRDLARVGTFFGMRDPKVERTDAFAAAMANQVLANIKVLGANPSNNDLKFVEKMAGGEIKLGEGSLREIIDINERAQRNIIKYHNEQVGPLMNTADEELRPYRDVLGVKMPGEYVRPQDRQRTQQGGQQGGQQRAPAATAAPAGTRVIVNPQTGERLLYDTRTGRTSPLTEGRPAL